MREGEKKFCSMYWCLFFFLISTYLFWSLQCDIHKNRDAYKIGWAAILHSFIYILCFLTLLSDRKKTCEPSCSSRRKHSCIGTSASACQHGYVHVGVFCLLDCKRVCDMRACVMHTHERCQRLCTSAANHVMTSLCGCRARHNDWNTRSTSIIQGPFLERCCLMCVTEHVGRSELPMSLRLTPQWFTPSLSWLTKLGLAAPSPPPRPHRTWLIVTADKHACHAE